VVPNPNDTFIHKVIVSKRTRKKKGRASAISLLVAPPQINTDVASPASLNCVHMTAPSRSPCISTLTTFKKSPALVRISPTVHEMVANFNNQVEEMDLDLSGLSELDVTSSDVTHTRTLPLSTVAEHEVEITNEGDQALDTNAPTYSPEKVAHKRSSLATNIGNCVENTKRGMKNWAVGLSSIALKRFSPIHAPIILPPPSTKALGSSTVPNPRAASSSQIDPPGSPISPEDDPNY
jgi:hypothetical protein